MPGQKKKQTAMQVLNQYAPEEVYEWIARGESINSISDRLGVARTGVHAWMNRPEHTEHIARARRIKAAGLVDDSMLIADNADPQTVQVAKLRAETRRWIASRLDREAWGDERGPQVAIQINGLHVDSLRVRNLDTEQD
jgi:hypothetical protein